MDEHWAHGIWIISTIDTYHFTTRPLRGNVSLRWSKRLAKIIPGCVWLMGKVKRNQQTPDIWGRSTSSTTSFLRVDWHADDFARMTIVQLIFCGCSGNLDRQIESHRLMDDWHKSTAAGNPTGKEFGGSSRIGFLDTNHVLIVSNWLVVPLTHWLDLTTLYRPSKYL